MPRIPVTVAQRGLAPRSGQPRTRLTVPAPQQPSVPLDAAAAVGEGLTSLGTGAQNLAILEGRRRRRLEAIELERQRAAEARQKAQDVLDAAETTQEFILSLNTRFDDLSREGDFRTLPETTEEEGRRLVEDFAQNLSPGARQRFEADALKYLATVQGKAFKMRTTRREEQKAFVVNRAIDIHARGLVEADNAASVAYHQGQLEALFQDGVSAGLFKGEDAAKKLQEAQDQVGIQRIRRKIRIDPEGALKILNEAARKGETELFGRPIADLIDEAQQERREALTFQEQEDTRSERRLRIEQGQHAVDLQVRVNDPDATIESLRAVIRDANRMALARDITPEDQDAITNRARTFIEKKLKDPVESDREVLKDLTLETFGAPLSGRELDGLRGRIQAAVERDDLDTNDGQRLLAEVEARRNRTYYANDPTYQEGVKILRQGISLMTLTASTAANRRQQQDLEFRTARALDHYARIMREIWQTQGREGVQSRALDEARKVRDLFGLDPRGVVENLPPSPYLEGATGDTIDERFDQAFLRLDEDRSLSSAERQMHVEYLELLEQIERAKAPSAAPVPPDIPSKDPGDSFFEKLMRFLGKER